MGTSYSTRILKHYRALLGCWTGVLMCRFVWNASVKIFLNAQPVTFLKFTPSCACKHLLLLHRFALLPRHFSITWCRWSNQSHSLPTTWLRGRMEPVATRTTPMNAAYVQTTPVQSSQCWCAFDLALVLGSEMRATVLWGGILTRPTIHLDQSSTLHLVQRQPCWKDSTT